VICGQSLRSLALELNARGVPTVKGKKWASSHLRSMLLRPRLAGLREHRGKIVAKGQWPPIIDKETHEALKAVLEDPRRCSGGSGQRGPVPTSLGTAIYRCGVCNEPRLRLGRSNARRAVYKCGNIDTSQAQGHVTRVADKLDAYVTDVLLRLLSRPGVVEAMCAVVDTDDAELAALRAEQVTIRPRLNKAAKRYEADEIDDEQLAIISKGLRDRDNEITAILTAANMRSPLDVLLGAESVEQMWDNELTLGQQRAILAEVLTVTVQPTTGGGRAPDGSYFNAASVDIALTERARKCTAAIN
jgi:site-specific DNA recombinase